MSSGEPVVEVSGLTVRYGSTTALRNVDVVIGPGVTGLVGVNGAGKSSLMRVLTTARRPDAGTIRLFGVDVLDDPTRGRRRIGYQPQSLAVPGESRVADFLGYVAWLRGIERKRRRDVVTSALAAVDLTDAAALRVRELSGGMYRRMLLAQALLDEPDLLVLDEPTAGLDPEQRVRVRTIAATAGETGAVLVSSHLLEDLVPIADRILMLDQGRLVFAGTVDELARVGNPTDQVVGISAHELAFLRLRHRDDG